MSVPVMTEEQFTALKEEKGLDNFEAFVLRREWGLPAEEPEHFPHGKSEGSRLVIDNLLRKTLKKIAAPKPKKES